MSTVVKGVLQRRWQPLIMTLRHRSKINITKPKPLHFERAVVENVCNPFRNDQKKPTHVPNYNECKPKSDAEVTVTPYELFLSKKLLNWFTNSKLIAFYHIHSMDIDENFQYKLLLKKNGLRCLTFGKNVVQIALKDTVYAPVIPLFQFKTLLAVSEETDLCNFLKVSKKLQKFVLMAAIVENKLLSFSQLQYYGKLQNLEESRTKLVGVLNAASQNLLQQINHHPNNMVQLLDSYQHLNKNK